VEDQARSAATWRSPAAAYLAVQAALGVIWWGLLAASPTVRSWFELLPHRHDALDAFLLADLAVFIGGSAASALTIWTGSRWAVTVTSFTAGGLVYATLYLVAWVVFEGSAAAGVAPMVVASAVTGAIAVRLRAEERR
jgi:hypothetical protein